ncbi:MAG: class I SAM-dependent methyltransferase, partial [Acinetobacter sp.]|uniref:class I SAM-dependent methyltransferase n=1 Tax=Acinetobacter sp. TaxID=472 RepID=UPI00257EF010
MAKDFNSQHVVDGYDLHIRKLIPGYEVVHQQIQALLKTHVHEKAHVLIVGCGTGYELGYLLQMFPQWTFTATELSGTMLDKAQQYLQPFNAVDRVEFILGDIDSLASECLYDAALAILVSHFIAIPEKPNFFDSIYVRLKPSAIFMTFDLTAIESEQDLESLENIAQINGLTAPQAKAMTRRLADD